MTLGSDPRVLFHTSGRVKANFGTCGSVKCRAARDPGSSLCSNRIHGALRLSARCRITRLSHDTRGRLRHSALSFSHCWESETNFHTAGRVKAKILALVEVSNAYGLPVLVFPPQRTRAPTMEAMTVLIDPAGLTTIIRQNNRGSSTMRKASRIFYHLCSVVNLSSPAARVVQEALNVVGKPKKIKGAARAILVFESNSDDKSIQNLFNAWSARLAHASAGRGHSSSDSSFVVHAAQ
jgi:hypothetical protein